MRQFEPPEPRPSRTRPLAVLPLFFDLNGRRAVATGSGEPLLWKAELLAAAGAKVDVFCRAPCAELAALAAAPPAGRVEIIARGWQPADLDDASLAVGVLQGREAAIFAAAAGAAGVPVNIVDQPQLSTFSFGTIVNRSPVVVGISTAGAAPVLGQAIRGKIEALLHPALASWAAAARIVRRLVNARTPMGTARRQLWRRFAERALSARAAPQASDIVGLTSSTVARGGSVTLVGAGPGDPELLTLKALRSLQSADIILYDRLVNPDILELARREAGRLSVGKVGHGASCRQDEINALMLRFAGEGLRVVRLKGGDPMVFGRAAEEIEACRAAAIPVEVVPGITAALGAAAELQVPLTDRRRARRLTFVSGHIEEGAAPNHDWESVAEPWTTTVIYMGASAIPVTLRRLLAAGLDPETPAVVVTAATTRRSHYVSCRARQLSEAIAGIDRREACLIIIGRAVGVLNGESVAARAPAMALPLSPNSLASLRQRQA
jgi:uroporphyrin-III C-methyltransferase / precorrin-2 dehydrogenase / sirohydrochlorin ferrochelatase